MESWTVLGWLLAVSTLGAQERMRIAVADFNAIDAKPSLGLSVAEPMRTELVNKNVFTILERAQMEKVLKEQGFQRTGVTEVESAVEMGRLLAAKKILVGTVSRFGATYTINCRIIGVEKGVAEFASSVQAANEEVLADSITTRILGRTVPSPQPPRQTGRGGMGAMRWVLPGGAMVAGGVGGWGLWDSNTKYTAAKSKYDIYKSSTDPAELERLHREIDGLLKNGDTSRLVMFVGGGTAAGLLAVWGVWEAVSAAGNSRSRAWEFRLTPSPRGTPVACHRRW